MYPHIGNINHTTQSVIQCHYKPNTVRQWLSHKPQYNLASYSHKTDTQHTQITYKHYSDFETSKLKTKVS